MQAIWKYSICCTAILTLLISCSQPKAKFENSLADTANVMHIAEVKNQKFEIRTYLNRGNKTSGWGYDIYMDNKLYIHQPHIPAVTGERGFNTEEQAKKVGVFVIQKIKNNVIPPTLSKEELDSLKIQNVMQSK